MMFRKILMLSTLFLLVISCVERGKPVDKKETKQTNKTSKSKKIAHYTCPNGHEGSDKQGKCNDCQATLLHNEAYHGLNLPKANIQDPFSNTSATNATPSPAQNKYGDYHYTCPNGHPGGSGSAGKCATCDAKLAHNQNYHR